MSNTDVGMDPEENVTVDVRDVMTGQTSITGETPAQSEIGPLASEYVRVRDERIEIAREESVAKANLLAACQRHNVTELILAGGYRVIVTSEENVKVTKEKASKDTEPDSQQTIRLEA